MKKKYVFLGETNSINYELICKSFTKLRNKVKYVLIGNKSNFQSYLSQKNIKINLTEIHDPINFSDYDKTALNFFNVNDCSNIKAENLLNQIKIANKLSNITLYDLITMPINKHIIKKQIKFNGLTEYFGKLNNKKTFMLMKGENFSVMPLTTHINPKNVYKIFDKNFNQLIKEMIYNLKIHGFKMIKFLCYCPHCGENSTIGLEDKFLKKIISKYSIISGPYPADSAFQNYNNKTVFISTYHDQALIPFKILNKKSINITLGLNFRRISPAHGTAQDIIGKNLADNSSYIQCMKI
tara:strand:- start:7 stop:894 length:888 start_codon:yes stop_codon:yes gene_type:complete